MSKTLPYLILVGTLLLASVSIGAERDSYKPEQGYVTDEQRAIAFSVAVWIPIYGKEHIEREKPYHASLKHGVWTVTGSLREGLKGGTAEARISKDNGCILRVIHYK